MHTMKTFDGFPVQVGTRVRVWHDRTAMLGWGTVTKITPVEYDYATDTGASVDFPKVHVRWDDGLEDEYTSEWSPEMIHGPYADELFAVEELEVHTS